MHLMFSIRMLIAIPTCKIVRVQTASTNWQHRSRVKKDSTCEGIGPSSKCASNQLSLMKRIWDELGGSNFGETL